MREKATPKGFTQKVAGSTGSYEKYQIYIVATVGNFTP
jgi:hypothetical protein